MRRFLAPLVPFLLIGLLAQVAVADTRLVDYDEFSALEERVTALEERLAGLDDGQPQPEEPHDDHGSSDQGDNGSEGAETGEGDEAADDPVDDEASGAPPLDEAPADRTISGEVPGFTVPSGQTWQIDGAVTSDANVVVKGVLRMRPGSSLTFTDVDESAFVGGGMQVVDTDVGLWVIGDGQLDVQGTPIQSWNHDGDHPSWESDHEFVRAPHGDERGPQPWSLGDDVPCTTFAGESYCAEVVNLSRDVTIQGTAQGQAHIFIRSSQPQTIRHAVLRHMAPQLDASEPDGRYAIHFHHAHDGSRGSIVEGVVVRDTGDHAFSAHESHGVTFRDTVAYAVVNTPYWWDPGDTSNDIRYERALALDVRTGRDSTSSLAGFRMGRGDGNSCIECVAAYVRGGNGSSGYLWNDGSPNKWVFRDSIAHHNNSGVWHWRNEGRAPFEPHRQEGFVTYSNSRSGIVQGAYEGYSHWFDTVAFDNGRQAVRQRSAPNKYRPGDELSSSHPDFETTADDLIPGTRYVGGAIGGSPGANAVLEVSARRHCEGPEDVGQHILFQDLWLLPVADEPVILINQTSSTCRRDDGRFHQVYRNVVVGEERRDLEREDFDLQGLPARSLIVVERTDGTTFSIAN